MNKLVRACLRSRVEFLGRLHPLDYGFERVSSYITLDLSLGN